LKIKTLFLSAAIIFTFYNLIFTETLHSQIKKSEKYSKVKIFVKNNSDINRIESQDLHFDHVIRKKDFLEAWLSESEIELLNKSGVSYQILINDWKKYYDELPKMSSSEINKAITESADNFFVSHSIYGSMGGFLKYSEVNAKLDSMRMEYPNLISVKFAIDSTVENRKIWTVRVSNSPNSPTGRPEIWYHSLIHAREPESMEHTIYFMYWLFENYQIDPIATYILENRELYFTPVLNPDGYVYNETNSPNGGGMWRKNRKNNGGGIYGVDLNRNYGIYQYWNSSNNGSSTSPSSETYRGVSPFSEPETKAVQKFVNSRNFVAILGSHTSGNLMIKPWAWQDPLPTPDDDKFNEYLADMTKYNHYTTGTPFQTVGYKVRGSADDWYYNDSAHSPHRIIAITPETGTTGFWPSQAEIIPLAQGMLFTNQYFAMLGGAYVFPESVNLNKLIYSKGESGTLKVKFKNKGLQTAQNVKIECTSPSYYLNIPVSSYNYFSLNSFDSDSSDFGFTISPALPDNSAIPVVINIKQNDSDIVYTETKYLLIGNGNVTFADSSENGFGKWTTNQGWALTSSQFYSPNNSFTDSPSGNYPDNASNSLTMSLPLNVSASPVTFLNFRHKYDTEVGYDYCYVEVSSNNGSSWQTVTSYNGLQSSWTEQNLDITSFANSSAQMKVRFTLKSDQYVTADGWYIDDIKIINYNSFINSVMTNVNMTVAPEGFYNSNTNSLNMNDTVALYLRNIYSPYIIIDSAKSVIDSLTFSGNFSFTNTGTGVYYYVIRHRNSIETWSKSGGEAFSFGGNMNYNFTTNSSQAYGNNLKQINSKYFIYSGDINQDGSIDASDLSISENDVSVNLSGYVTSDLTGDYYADGSDLSIIENNASLSILKIVP
jgi:carboxypeptidase T